MTLTNKKTFIFFTFFIIIADQVSKYLIKTNLSLYKSVPVLGDFFQIIHVQNRGAIWGIFSGTSDWLMQKIITGFSIVALGIVIYFFLKLKDECRLELLSLSFITGGAVGNIIDRLAQGFVVDFLDFQIIGYHWPTFNIADSFISVGVCLMIISVWKGKCPSI